MKIQKLFLFFLLFRLMSVFVIQTSYVPDEYWQSLEVAHKMVFGYGYLTWEWKQNLRSYFYPLIFAYFYKFLQVFQIDFPSFIIFIPRLFQACLTAVSDVYFILLGRYFKCDDYWNKVYLLTNWFWFYCGSRTISNTFETSLTIIALYYFPWELFIAKKKSLKLTNLSELKNTSLMYMTLSGLACVIRPTAISIWGPLFVFHLSCISLKHLKQFFLTCVLPVFLFVVCFSLGVDFIWYGNLTIPAYNFFILNVVKDVSSFYGTHPFHWYITQGLPAVLGLQYLPFCIGLLLILRNSFKPAHTYQKVFLIWLCIILVNVLILSKIPHKEFRFALPLLPLMLLIASKTSTDYFTSSKGKAKLAWTSILAISFFICTALFGIFHQRGPLQLMKYLRNEAADCSSKCFFLFLMPCHSTPLYSHLHVNVSTKFLTCDPPIEGNDYDESDAFFSDPVGWLNEKWDDNNPPSHVAFFDSLEESIIQFLQLKGFIKKFEFLHTVLAEKYLGKYIVVYEPS